MSTTPRCTAWADQPRSRRLYQLTKGVPVIAGMPRNMSAIVVTREMSHVATSPVKPEPRNRSLMSVTPPTSQPLRSSSNEEAPWNIPAISVTPLTSQSAMPPVSAVALRKAWLMSVAPVRFGASTAAMVRFSAPSK